MTKLFMRLFVFSAFLSVVPIYSACGDDEEDLTEINPDDPDTPGSGSETGNKVNLVGRTVIYHRATKSHGYDDILNLYLTFKTSTSYSIRRQGSYYMWNNGAYRQYFFDETKTGTYSVAGQVVTMKGNYPFCDREQWANDDWQLVYHGNFLTNIEDSQDEPTWTFLN